MPAPSSRTKKPATAKKPKGIDWEALGYKAEDEEYKAASEIKVDTGPTRFRVSAKKTYRIGFPFVAPSKSGGFEVRLKPVEHLKYYDEDTKSSAKFVMPKNEKLRKQVVDVFSSDPVNTHYLTPVIVYDTNDEGKLLSRKEVSYSIKVLAIPAGRYAKLKEASEQFSLANYDFHVSLEGDEKTENYQKMNFKAVTSKDLNSKTATWQKGLLVKLPDDEEEEPTPVSMEEVIAECYEMAEDMVSVLGVRELKDNKIKEILAEWSDEEEDEAEDEEPEDEDEYEDEYEEEYEEEYDEAEDEEVENEDPDAPEDEESEDEEYEEDDESEDEEEVED